jgi:hypothetical protein
MSKHDSDYEAALEFAATWRGQYILSRALVTAIAALENVKPAVMVPRSDINDMRYLMENLWPLYKSVQTAEDTMKAMEGQGEDDHHE